MHGRWKNGGKKLAAFVEINLHQSFACQEFLAESSWVKSCLRLFRGRSYLHSPLSPLISKGLLHIFPDLLISFSLGSRECQRRERMCQIGGGSKTEFKLCALYSSFIQRLWRSPLEWVPVMRSYVSLFCFLLSIFSQSPSPYWHASLQFLHGHEKEEARLEDEINSEMWF